MDSQKPAKRGRRSRKNLKAGAQEGNQFGVKLKDPDVRQRAYRQYCAWIAQGKSIDTFTFEEDSLTCSYKTILSYIEKYPDEFPPLHIEMSKLKGKAFWESVVESSAKGENKDANTASLQMLMRNKYGWDKPEKHKDEIDTAALDKLAAFFSAIAKSSSKDKE